MVVGQVDDLQGYEEGLEHICLVGSSTCNECDPEVVHMISKRDLGRSLLHMLEDCVTR